MDRSSSQLSFWQRLLDYFAIGVPVLTAVFNNSDQHILLA
jgi:hypothetical protein